MCTYVQTKRDIPRDPLVITKIEKLQDYVLQCVTVCCSALQYVAVFYSVLQCVAVCCSVLYAAVLHRRIIIVSAESVSFSW